MQKYHITIFFSNKITIHNLFNDSFHVRFEYFASYSTVQPNKFVLWWLKRFVMLSSDMQNLSLHVTVVCAVSVLKNPNHFCDHYWSKTHFRDQLLHVVIHVTLLPQNIGGKESKGISDCLLFIGLLVFLF